MDAYLILDIGTGNVRVALTGLSGEILTVNRDNVHYKKDGKYPEALFFEPDTLWSQILNLIKKSLQSVEEVKILGATVSSQREGIVLIDKAGKSMVGFPNHDHRGRYLVDELPEKDKMYRLTGRYPSSLFSAVKLKAYQDKYPEKWEDVDCFLSISDWGQYMLTGQKSYEHAQASETLLYDVENKKWSEELLASFGFPEDLVPPLKYSGERVGEIKKEIAEEVGLAYPIPVFVGGADTQLAIQSTRLEIDDIVLVSGTTTPVVEVITSYVLDEKQRSWTNSHLNESQYILETNCGVTGLNFQRVKEIFYLKDSYEVIAEELDRLEDPACFAHLGSLIADDKEVVTRGGFLFEVPIMTGLSRADFAFAALWDIACSIKENFECLLDIKESDKDFVWCCGGGFQSPHLRKYVSGLIGKKLLFRPGYQQASVSGAAVVCSQALDKTEEMNTEVETVLPENAEKYEEWYQKWKQTREALKKMRRN